MKGTLTVNLNANGQHCIHVTYRVTRQKTLTDRSTLERQKDRQARHADRQTGRHTDRPDMLTDRQTDWQAGRPDRQTDRQTDRPDIQTDR